MNMKYIMIAGFIGLFVVFFVFGAVQNSATAETTQNEDVESGVTCEIAQPTCGATIGGSCSGNGCTGGGCEGTKPKGCGC